VTAFGCNPRAAGAFGTLPRPGTGSALRFGVTAGVMVRAPGAACGVVAPGPNLRGPGSGARRSTLPTFARGLMNELAGRWALPSWMSVARRDTAPGKAGPALKAR
jgi:hypothetical protein